MRKPYSPAWKAKVVLEMLQESRSVTEIAADYQIAPRLLHRWRREVVDHLPALFANAAAIARGTQAQEAKREACSLEATQRPAHGAPPISLTQELYQRHTGRDREQYIVDLAYMGTYNEYDHIKWGVDTG